MSRRKHPISNRFRHLRFESLETRQLMAVDLQAMLGADGILRVEGTPNADTISEIHPPPESAVPGPSHNEWRCDMRGVTLLALCLLASFSPASLADDNEDRSVWAYEGGWFSTKDGENWNELSFDIYNDNADKPLKFKELNRTKEYVEIYDASRKLSVRLSETKMEWKDDAQDEWNALHKGRWKKWGP